MHLTGVGDDVSHQDLLVEQCSQVRMDNRRHTVLILIRDQPVSRCAEGLQVLTACWVILLSCFQSIKPVLSSGGWNQCYSVLVKPVLFWNASCCLYLFTLSSPITSHLIRSYLISYCAVWSSNLLWWCDDGWWHHWWWNLLKSVDLLRWTTDESVITNLWPRTNLNQHMMIPVITCHFS